jgi:putative endonuclease
MGGWAYMLQCSDSSFYVGSTSHDDVNVRVAEHNEARYAGYTSSRRPVSLVWSEWFDDLRDAHTTERQIKGWGRAKKMALIQGDHERLAQLSRRRSGNPKSAPRFSKRQLAHSFQSVVGRHPEVAVERPAKDGA